jgi:hypothetical protein
MPKFRVRLSREIEQITELVVEASDENTVWSSLPEHLPDSLIWRNTTTFQGTQIDYIDEYAADDESADVIL